MKNNRFGLITLFSLLIPFFEFAQPSVCSPASTITGATINYSGSGMFSPTASPFWNQGGSGIPGLNSYNICRESGTVTVSASSIPAGYSIAWFRDDSPSGFAAWPGLPPVYLGTGSSITDNVPAFDDSYAIIGYYYNNSTGCINRSGGSTFSMGCVGGLIVKNHGNGNSQLGAGDLIPNPVCEGDPVTLNYTGPNPGSINPTYGIHLYNNPSYTGTPIRSSNNGCGSCLPATFTLPAGTYYGTLSLWPTAQCFSTLPPVVLNVLPRPNGPTSANASPSILCLGGSSTLSGSCPTGTLVWYNNSSGAGSPVPGGSSPTVNHFSSGTYTYYAFCDNGSCLSNNTLSASVTVIDPNDNPAFPSASPSSDCAGFFTNLSASCPSGGVVRWYTSPTGTGTGISNPYYVTNSQTVYARCYYSTAPVSCQYSSSSPLSLTVTPQPSNPTSASASPNTGCIPYTTTLTANCGSNTVRWYTSPSGTGSGIGSNPTVSSPGTTTFYAKCFNNSAPPACQYSAGSVSVSVTGYNTPNSPTSVSATNNNLCPGYTTTLSGTCSSGSLRWYTSPSGTGTGISMPYTVNAAITLYGKCYDNTVPAACAYSNSVAFNLNVSSSPSNPISLGASPNNGCGPYTSTLSGTCSSGSIRWYSSSSGSGAGLSMPVNVSVGNTTFYAKCYNASFPVGCQYGSVDSITLNITTPVNVVISGPNNVCVNSTATYTSSHSPGNWFISSGAASGSINNSGILTTNGTPGTIIIGFSYPNGACMDTGYYSVTVTLAPSSNLNDTAMCLGSSVQLNPTSSGGTYTIISGPGSISASGLFTNNISPGVTRIVYALALGGCNLSDTLDITTHPLPNTPSLSTNADTVCLGSFANLTGTCSGSSLYWYTNNSGTGTPVFIGNSYTFFPTTNSTLYAFCFDGVTGCRSSNYDSVIVIVTPCTDTITRLIPSNGCGDTIVLSTIEIPSGPNYINTCDGSGFTSNGDPVVFLNDSTIVIKPTSYPYQPDSVCIIMCNTSIPVCDTTLVYLLPDTNMPPITLPSITCYDDTLYLDASGVAIVSPGQVSNVNFYCFDGSVSLSENTFYCADTGTHLIWVYARTTVGLSDSCQATITVLDTTKPTIWCPSVMNDTVEDICEYIIPDYSNHVFDNCSSDTVYITQIPAPGTIIDISQFGLRNFTQRVYIYATDGSNNTDSCYFDLELVCNINLKIPEFISPNGDGINDTWYIDMIELFPNSKVKVFNRWGNEVFNMDNYDNSWSGIRNKGGENPMREDGILPSGTYFYMVDKGTGEDIVTGYLFIRR